MASERETDPILAGMLAKVAAWQAAVDSYRAAKALEQGASGDVTVAGAARGVIELPINAFRGMTLNEAIKLFFQSVQRKQTASEIAEGLKRGGLVSTAKDVGPTIRSALNKLKADGVLLRFPDGWDLAEAHSAAIRNRVTKETSRPRSRRKSASTKRVAKKEHQAKARKTQGPADTDPNSMAARVVSFLRQRGKPSAASDVAAAVGSDTKVVGLALGRLKVKGRVTRNAEGLYSAAD